MKKISLAVFNTQPPHRYFGGVERRIVETTQRIRGEVTTTVYSGTKAGFRKPATVNGVHYVPYFSTDAIYPLDNWVFNRSLYNAVDKVKADVYEAHTASGYGFQRALMEQRIRTPFIHTIHGVLADEYAQAFKSGFTSFRDKLANLIMWRLSQIEEETARNATLIVTVSRYSSKRISQLYDADPAKIRVVPNGVDPEKFKPFSGLEKIKHQIGIDSKLCVLFVGRLIPRKGLPYLVEAAKQVIKEFTVLFLIVGNGPLRGRLEAYLERINLSRNFVFLGDVKESVLPAVYNCADVFALPSIQEGQGIALLEAQSTAKPVVAFNVGGVPEAMVAGETGLLVKPDSAALADALKELLSNFSLREQMGRRGREFVSNNFTWDICAQRMLGVYREALGVRGR
jgi:glycosyltransferase involved in cell wall biosynthesis